MHHVCVRAIMRARILSLSLSRSCARALSLPSSLPHLRVQHLAFEHINELHLVPEPGDQLVLLLDQLLLLRQGCVDLLARCGTHDIIHYFISREDM
jgi:hypothetical protein